MLNLAKVYRIVCARNEKPEVNMVYAEVGGEDCEVFGVFSGIDAGGGLFYQTADGDTTVSDDPGDFTTSLATEVRDGIFKQLESLRSDFETYDDSGELIGLSEEGLSFIRGSERDERGAVVAFSEGASEDFIYDCQDQWNLHYYID